MAPYPDARQPQHRLTRKDEVTGRAMCAAISFYTISLSVAFCAVVGFAEHFTVSGGSFAAFAPGAYVIGVHVVVWPDFR